MIILKVPNEQSVSSTFFYLSAIVDEFPLLLSKYISVRSEKNTNHMCLLLSALILCGKKIESNLFRFEPETVYTHIEHRC